MNLRPLVALVLFLVVLSAAAPAGPAPQGGASLPQPNLEPIGARGAPGSDGPPAPSDQVGGFSCDADLDGSGNVGFGDLTAILIHWGPCAPGPCPWDLDESGDVGFSDLTVVLTTWGCTSICNPNGGSCLIAHGTPGCHNTTCCDSVCGVDPSCCTEWDQACANQALALCDLCSGDGEYCDTAMTAVTGDNAGDTTDNTADDGDESSCVGNDGIDEWWCWTAPFTGEATASTCNQANFNTTIAVFEGCFFNDIACSNNAIGCSGGTSQVTWVVVGGTEYKIRVAGASSTTGTYTLTMSCELIEGDTCEAPFALFPLVLDFDDETTDAFGTTDVTSCGAGDTIDEWLSWTAPSTGAVTISVCNDDTDFDTTLAVFAECGGTEIACNDDAVGCTNGRSELTWSAVGATKYLIRIAGVGGATGEYHIEGQYPPLGDCCIVNGGIGCNDTACLSLICGQDPLCCTELWDQQCADAALAQCGDCTGGVGSCESNCCEAHPGLGCDDVACESLICLHDPFCCDTAWDQLCADAAVKQCGLCTPDGDECNAAMPATTGANAGDTTNNTGSTGDDTSCGAGDTIDEWWCWTAPCDGTARASTCGQASFDTTIAVFDACGGSELACNDNGAGCGTTSVALWPVVANTSYKIRVSGVNGSTGTYTLTLICSP